MVVKTRFLSERTKVVFLEQENEEGEEEKEKGTEEKERTKRQEMEEEKKEEAIRDK